MNKKVIVTDGIVDQKAYTAAPVKVLYLLKEANGGETDWDLTRYVKFLSDPVETNNPDGRFEERWQTWRRIMNWQNTIHHIYDDKNEMDLNNRKILREICVVNVKKQTGCSVSNMTVINNCAKANQESLKSQIEQYEPDLVICCGTSAAAEILFNPMEWIYTNVSKPNRKRPTTYAYFVHEYKHGKKLTVLEYVHPQSRMKKAVTIDNISAIVKEIKENS